MNTAVINIKTDPNLKSKAQKVASDLGFSLSSLLNGYMRQLIRTRTVYFSTKSEEPSEYMIQALRESEEDRKAGRYRSFDSTDKALEYLDKLIDGNKKG